MDINKLTNHVNGQLNGSKAADSSQKTSETAPAKQVDKFSDKVSLENFSSRKNEQLFAKIELEKLNQSSFNRLKDYKAKISEYERAKNESPEAAKNTEIGKMINDPEVWGNIARNILDK